MSLTITFKIGGEEVNSENKRVQSPFDFALVNSSVTPSKQLAFTTPELAGRHGLLFHPC